MLSRENMAKRVNKQRNIKRSMLPEKIGDVYLNMFTLRECPVTIDWLEKFALKLMHRAKHDESMLTISEFYIDEGVCWRDFKKWVELYPNLKIAHEHALRIIGNRRIKGGITRRYDASLIKYTQPLFDPEFKELARLWSELAQLKNNANNSDRITVIMQPIANSELVPNKQVEQREQ